MLVASLFLYIYIVHVIKASINEVMETQEATVKTSKSIFLLHPGKTMSSISATIFEYLP